MELWFAALFQAAEPRRLSSELLDKSNDSNSPKAPCVHISAHKAFSMLYPLQSGWKSEGKSLALLHHSLKFHHARITAHNQVCKVLATFLQKYLAAQGLVLELVPTDVNLKSGRNISDSETCRSRKSLVRWQPHFIAMLYTIAIGPEVCRQSATPAENLVEAYHRKMQAYPGHPFLVALKTTLPLDGQSESSRGS